MPLFYSFIIVGLLDTFLCEDITTAPPPTSSPNTHCFYSFVVPQGPQGCTGESSTAEVTRLRQELSQLESTATNLEGQLSLIKKIVCKNVKNGT